MQILLDASKYQYRFWLEWKLNPKSLAYNLCLLFEINGNLKKPCLFKALDRLVNKEYELCRSYFIEKAGLKQVLLNKIPVQISEENISSFSSKSSLKNKSRNSFITRIAGIPYNLSTPPLFRFGLLKENSKKYLLVLAFHHIISDGFCGKFLVHTISNLYNHFAYSLPINLKKLPTVSDYVGYELTEQPSEKNKQDLSYWINFLKDKTLYNELPFKNAYLKKSKQLKSIHFKLNKKTTTEFKKCVYSLHTSPFILLATIYSILLAYYTQKKQITLVYPVNIRPPHFKNLPGCFINNLPLITEINLNETVQELACSLTRQRKITKQHQTCPLDQIIKALRQTNPSFPQKLLNISLFETHIGLLPLDLCGLDVKAIPSPIFESLNDIALAYQFTKQLIFRLDYKCELFDSKVIRNFTKHFVHILKQCLKNAKQKIQNIDILLPQEKQKILIEWNKTDKPFPKDKTIHQLFEEQVKRTPNKIAVTFENQSLTYQKLNAKANQLARYLQKLGVTIETLVPICMNRCLEFIISILGILKAGCAYVPIDPKYPKNRIYYMLNNIQAKLLITNSKTKLPLLATKKLKTLFLNQLFGNTLKNISKKNLNLSINSHNLAYGIYTSGSTGKPKIVLAEHLGAVNVIIEHINLLRLSISDNILHFNNFSFDPSLVEWSMALLTGATLRIYSTTLIINLQKFSQEIQTYNILKLILPNIFLEKLPLNLFNSIQVVIGGGTSPSARLIKTILHRGKTFINVYGPTETTICTTTGKLRKSDKIIHIGKPIANVKVYVLNKNQRVTPIGVPGELYIGGVGVARGYLNKPKLTQEKFIPNPLTGNPKDRFYKSGDLVRWLSDGNLEFIGRLDDQVKVRGFRIELNEVNIHIQKFKDVKQSVVLVKEDAQQQKFLAAFIIPENINTFSIEKLRLYLQQFLPPYMIPSFFALVKKFPLTHNGKIDKQTLLKFSPEENQPLEQTSLTATEKIISNIFKKLLNSKQIDVHRNFFEIGAHSLMLIEVCNVLNEEFMVNLLPIDLFTYTTVQSLAGFIQKAQENKNPGQPHVDSRWANKRQRLQRKKRAEDAKKRRHL